MRHLNRPLAALVAAATLAASALPAMAEGRWLPGGTFDPDRLVGIQFLRYLAEPGEAQMTIRCDALSGLSVDVGVAGNGTLPTGVEVGAAVAATLTFVRTGGENATVTASGPVEIRSDGAVLVTIEGDAARPLGALLTGPGDRIDITIAGEDGSVTMAGLTDFMPRVVRGCGVGWPGPA